MAVDFTQFMSKPIGEMKRVLLPQGHYFATIRGTPEPKESGTGKPMLNIQFSLASAGDDVEGPLPENGVQGRIVSVNYMMDQDFGQDDIRKAIEACGIATDPTQGWGQYVPQMEGKPVKIYIKHRPRDKQDPNSEMTEDVSKVLRAE